MLVSGGKVLALDKVKTDEKVFTGDGAFNSIGLKIEQPINQPYGYNPALEEWVEVANAGDIGIDKVSHDKTLVGDGNTNKLGINLSDAIDPEKVYGFKQDGSMAEVATEGKKYEAGEFIDSSKLDEGVISVTGVQEKGDYATKDFVAEAAFEAKEEAISDAASKYQVKGDYATVDYATEAAVEAKEEAIADAASKYQEKGDYATKDFAAEAAIEAKEEAIADAASKYQEKGDYATKDDIADMATTEYVIEKMANAVAIAEDDAAEKYQEKGNYATIDYADKVSISARNIAINTASAYTNSQSYMYRSVSAGSIINSDSYALGSACVADGKCSVAEGFSTIAHGNYSHTEGYATRTISAETAPAIKNWREGFAAHAEGEDTRAYGNYSHAEGNGTITNNVCEHAEGRYNKSNFHSSAFGDGKNTLHSVGIGTSEYDHKNAFEIMQNGDTYLSGIGEYNGINASADDVQTLQDVINEKATTEYVDDKAEEASAAAVEDAASKYQPIGDYATKTELEDQCNLASAAAVASSTIEIGKISGYGFSAWSAVSGGVGKDYFAGYGLTTDEIGTTFSVDTDEVLTTSMMAQSYSFANTDSILVNIDDTNKQISFDAVGGGGGGSTFTSADETKYNKNEQAFYYIPMKIETATASWGNDGILHIVVENA